MERAVVVEIQPGKLVDTELVVDFDDGVDFFAAIAVGFEAHAGFEQAELGGELWVGRRLRLPVFFFGLCGLLFGLRFLRFLRGFLRACFVADYSKEETGCGKGQQGAGKDFFSF